MAHKNVFMALAAAQAEMGSAKKSANNPHFKSKYADLAEIVDVAKPVLTKHGLCYYHTLEMTEQGRFMVTVLAHGESETEIRCPVELMIGKTDMQSYKSATTYAKRIGLESVTGIAPEDDDGNAASAAAPKSDRKAPGIMDDNRPNGMDPWVWEIIKDLPGEATDLEKATAVAGALAAQVKRKKSLGELDGEWDRRAKIIENLKKFHGLHGLVVDAFEIRRNELTEKVAAE
jgi:hypothetical protein